MALQLTVHADAAAVARAAARFIAAQARCAIGARGRFTLAVSGGRTPWQMLRVLADEAVDWTHVQLFQVDERVAPPGDAARNLTHLEESLLAHVDLPAANVHAMPVEASDLDAAADRYALTLATIAGTPPILDLVHLGLDDDGHVASLVPGDPVLAEDFRSVAVTQPYAGHRRMTLTFPVLDRARCVLFVVTGQEKALALQRLQAGDRRIPAARVTGERACILADVAAAGSPATA